MIDFIFGVTKGDIVYDIETYPNCFTCCCIHSETGEEWLFEMSDRKNQIKAFCVFLEVLRSLRCRMVGFNNLGFDYPIIHYIYVNRRALSLHHIYQKSQAIINKDRKDYSHNVWEGKHIVQQIDLYKIYHFDNKARATGLKVLEFNMRSDTIEDLPYTPGTILNNEQIDNLILYNKYDVLQTLKFYRLSSEKIKFREEIAAEQGVKVMNYSDVKLGTHYFETELEKAKPGACFTMMNGKKCKRKTPRSSIQIKDVILPYISFQDSQLNKILDDFRQTTIVNTKGSIKRSYIYNGLEFDCGTGGIHGSVKNTSVMPEKSYIIEDWDVKSYYPNLAIVNNFFPEHLSVKFCDIYKQIYDRRAKHEKGTSQNAMLKLALNGVYGDSNSEYSSFYDPKYTMSITVNGQLLLCKLMEMLFIDTMQFIQINTDGISIKYHESHKEWVHSQMKKWEVMTGLQLENVEYECMFIRDVNNYIAKEKEGNIKRKGAYEYELDWHQKHSMLVVKKAVNAYLLEGISLEEFIYNHDDIFDFMMIAKLPKSMKLIWGNEQIQNTSRFYVSTDGDYLSKVIPAPEGKEGLYKRANKLTDEYYNKILKEVGTEWDERIHTLNKSVYDTTTSDICAGYTVRVCNDMKDSSFTDINFDYYIREAKKLAEVFE